MTDLITLSQYKAYKGINGSNSDAVLTSFCTAISELVKTYCGRTFIDHYATSTIQKFTLKWGQNVVFLRETPMVAIVEVKELADDSLTTYNTLVGTDYVFDPNLDALYRIEDGAQKDFPIGINSVSVEYRGGYAATPTDLQLACMDLVTYYWKEEHKPAIQQGGVSITNLPRQGEVVEFPSHIKRVLDLYRDV